MNIPQFLQPAVTYLRKHVSQETMSNERLIVMAGAAAGLFLMIMFIGFWSLNQSMAKKVTTSKTNLARLQAEVTGDAWPKRVETTQGLKTQLTVRLWDAPTPGLAQASFETWLNQSFGRYGAKPQQILITRSPAVGRDGNPTPTLAGLQRMTAKVLAPFDQTALQVLADAAEYQKILVVDRLILRSGINSRMEMDISTFIRAEASAQAKP